MLQTLRDNLKGTVAIIIVGLMIIPFALFGVDSLFLQDNTAGKAAEVNGEAISEMDLNRAIQLQKQQIIQRLGDQAPAELLVDDQLREPVLTRLIRRELLRQASVKGDMGVSEASLDQLIVSTPQFQQDGKFSPELYTQLLRNMGYTPASYKKLLIEDILINQYATGITNSAFATPTDLQQLTALTQQKRSFYFMTLPMGSVDQDFDFSEEELKAYYDKSQASFMSVEQVNVDYLELSLDDIAAAIDVDPAQVNAQFQQELNAFEPVVRRNVAHILIESGDQAGQKIEMIKSKLAAGESFAKLAEEYSEDLGSNELGGDLGMTEGATFPESFETALAKLDVGQVSDVVETDAGFHFIKLLAEEKTSAPELADVRQEIADSLAMAEAESLYLQLLEELPDVTYNAENLFDAAEQLNIELKNSGYFSRTAAVGVMANNQVKAAIFSDDVLHKKLSSDVIEISPNHVVVVKLKDYKPSLLSPFTDVKDEIIARLSEEKIREQLTARAEKFVAELEAGASMERLADANSLQWQVKAGVLRNESSVSGELINRIFSLPKPDDKAVNTTFTLPNGDQVVAQLTVVEAGTLPALDEAQTRSVLQRLSQELGSNEFAVYQSALDERAKIETY